MAGGEAAGDAGGNLSGPGVGVSAQDPVGSGFERGVGNPADQVAPPGQPPGWSGTEAHPDAGHGPGAVSSLYDTQPQAALAIERGFTNMATRSAIAAVNPFGALGAQAVGLGIPGLSRGATAMGATGPASGPTSGQGQGGMQAGGFDPNAAVSQFRANLKRRRA